MSDLKRLRRQLAKASEEANAAGARGDEHTIGAVALWDRKKAEYLARGQALPEAKRNATEYVSRIYGPPPNLQPTDLGTARADIRCDMGHAVTRAGQVFDALDEMYETLEDGALTMADIGHLEAELRKLLTYTGYVTRSITRVKKDLETLRTATVRVQ